MALQMKHLLLGGSSFLAINLGETRRSQRLAMRVRAWQSPAMRRPSSPGRSGGAGESSTPETADGCHADVGRGSSHPEAWDRRRPAKAAH